MSVLGTKSAVRSAVLGRRTARDGRVRADAAVALQRHLLAGLQRHLHAGLNERGTGLVAAHAPVGAEPGGATLPAALRAHGLRVLLPVLLPDLDLDWAEYRGPDSLAPGARGLREPTGPRWGVAAVAGTDAVVVPAVAVDARGVRLGRGGGSYDRALARVPTGLPVVALLYDDELVERVPAEPHDRRVTAVVTPGGGWQDL